MHSTKRLFQIYTVCTKMGKKAQECKRLVHQFCAESTFHGLPGVVTDPARWMRIMWLMLFFTGTLISLYETTKAAESNSAPFAVLHVNDVCRWTWQLLLRGSFSKRSTGRRVKRVNGSTGHFHFHYIIYDSRQRQAHATRCKKHTAYEDSRLTPHRCKKHTASFPRSTGKFPSNINMATTLVTSYHHKQVKVC